MLSEKDLIKGCKEYNIKAQQALYKRFARKMTGVCYYYTGSVDDAKDLLHEGFIKIFAKFGQYKEEGSAGRLDYLLKGIDGEKIRTEKLLKFR